MALVCDVCATKFGHSDCRANLNVSPTQPNLKIFQALAAAGRSWEPVEPLALDLCVECTKKVLGILGLSAAVCESPAVPEPTPNDEAPERPNIGALTAEDLRQLGLTGDDLRQVGPEPKDPTKPTP